MRNGGHVNGAQRLASVELRHPQIHQDHVDLLGLSLPHGLPSAVCIGHDHTELLQKRPDNLPVDGIIVGDKDPPPLKIDQRFKGAS